MLSHASLLQLGYRFAHILRRMLPIAMHLLQKEGQFLTGHELFLKRVGASFQAFIEFVEKTCRAKCLEDLQSTTRYVTWSLHTKSRASLKAMLSKVAPRVAPALLLCDGYMPGCSNACVFFAHPAHQSRCSG